MQALVKLSHFALAIRLVFSWKKLTVLSSIARRVDRGWGGGGGSANHGMNLDPYNSAVRFVDASSGRLVNHWIALCAL